MRERVVLNGSVIGVPSPIPDEVEGRMALLIGDTRHRQNLRRVHDGGVKANLNAFVQKDRVEYLPSSGVESERDIRQAQNGLYCGKAPFEFPNTLDGFDSVASRFLLPGCNRESEHVDHDVVDLHPPRFGEVGDESVGDTHFPLSGSRLTLFVNRQGNHRGTVLNDHRHHAGET